MIYLKLKKILFVLLLMVFIKRVSITTTRNLFNFLFLISLEIKKLRLQREKRVMKRKEAEQGINFFIILNML